MSYRTEHTQTIVGWATPTELRLTTERRDSDYSDIAGTATLVISTGTVRLQTYATASELRNFAYAALKAALDLDAIATESEVLEVAK